MLVAIMFTVIIAISLVVVILIISSHSYDGSTCLVTAFLGFLLALTVVIFACALRDYNNLDIKPIDVYQGKTTLKYEIIDGVKVDSTVVWKENLNE